MAATVSSRLWSKTLAWVTLIGAVLGLLVILAAVCAGIWIVGYVMVGPFLGG